MKNKRKGKKLLAVLLSAAMVFSMGMTTFAEENGSDNSTDFPIVGATLEDNQQNNVPMLLSDEEWNTNIFSDTAESQSFSSGGLSYKILSEAEVAVSGVDSSSTEFSSMIKAQYKLDVAGAANVTELSDLIIPAEVEYDGKTYTVTQIAQNALRAGTGYINIFASIQFPNTLTAIDNFAFMNTVTQTDITIPDSVTSIGDYAFAVLKIANTYYASGEEKKINFVLGSGLSALPKNLFYQRLIDTLTIGENVNSIDTKTFYLAASISNIVILGEENRFGTAEEFSGKYLYGYTTNVSYGEKIKTLQDRINEAAESETIALDENVFLDKTVIIPEGKNITLTDDGSAKEIRYFNNTPVTPLFDVKGSLTITTTNGSDELLTLSGYPENSSLPAHTGSVVTVDGGTFTLQHGTINGGKITSETPTGCGAIVVKNGARFVMTGGIIQNTEIRYFGYYSAGGVVVSAGSKFNMSGGMITNCSNAEGDDNANLSGGGVCVYAERATDKRAEMTISGDAVITGNSSIHGAGILLVGSVDFTMTGGTISNNTADSTYGNGGGICATDATVDNGAAKCKVVIDGGTITGNFAYSGGGVYSNTTDTHIKGGIISKNTAKWNGGGVYNSTKGYSVELESALIRNNNASKYGGGIAICSNGTLDLGGYNIAVYGNTAEEAGDDIMSLNKTNDLITSSGSYTSISNNLLGGGFVSWYRDGYVFNATNSFQIFWGSVNPDYSRYKDTAEPELVTNIERSWDSYSLKAIVTPKAMKYAEKAAKLIIEDNTASYGGGVGSNGELYIYPGEETQIPEDCTINLHAYKQLDNDNPVGSDFLFEVWEGETRIQRVYNNDEDVNFSFEHDCDETENHTHTYTIKEVNNGLDGIVYDSTEFTVTVNLILSGNSWTAELASDPYTPVFNNWTEPDEPYIPPYIPPAHEESSEPEEPSSEPSSEPEPEEPSEPVIEPSEPSEPAPSEPEPEEVKPIDKTPQTSDESNLTFWLVILGASALGLIAALIFEKRSRYQPKHYR